MTSEQPTPPSIAVYSKVRAVRWPLLTVFVVVCATVLGGYRYRAWSLGESVNRLQARTGLKLIAGQSRIIRDAEVIDRMPGYLRWIITTDFKLSFPPGATAVAVPNNNPHSWYEEFYQTTIKESISDRESVRWETASDSFRVSSIRAGGVYYYMIQSDSKTTPP